MNIHIKTTNLTLTPEIKEYFDKKMEGLDRLIDPNDTSVSCQVELGKISNHHKSGDIYRAEINFMRDGKQFRAVSEQETLMAAMDEAKDEIIREFKGFKSKQTTMMRRGGAAIKNMMKGIGTVGYNIGSSVGNFGGSVGSSIGSRIRKFKFRGKK